MKIAFEAFVYELINYLFINEIIILYTWLRNYKPVDYITK